MVSERYVIKKIGDRYVPLPQVGSGTGAGWIAGGAAMLGIGLLRRGALGSIAALAGAGLIYRGMTGKIPLAAMLCGRRSNDEQGPSFQHDFQSSSDQKPQDEVEEASMESFPASDAPAHTTSTSSP